MAKKNGIGLTFREGARIAGVEMEDCLEFFALKRFIKREPWGWSATGMGVEFGYVVNDCKFAALLTPKGVCKAGVLAEYGS